MTTQPEHPEQLNVGFTLRPVDANEMRLRQLILGSQPLVLIEADMEADVPTFDIDATGFDDLDVLADFLAGMSDACRMAKAKYVAEGVSATTDESKES